jgi:hypothetical protein
MEEWRHGGARSYILGSQGANKTEMYALYKAVTKGPKIEGIA